MSEDVSALDDVRLRDLKVVVVGDGAVGKTCLCTVFTERKFPVDYNATIFENFPAKITIDGKEISFQLMDTAGQESYKNIRTLSYENTDCFIVCFSVVDSVSFENIASVWIEELRRNQPSAKILLTGTKADLRGQKNEDNTKRTQEVSLKKIKRLVKKEGLAGYVETSALFGGDDVDRVFTEAVRLGLGMETRNSIFGRDDKDSDSYEKLTHLCNIV